MGAHLNKWNPGRGMLGCNGFSAGAAAARMFPMVEVGWCGHPRVSSVARWAWLTSQARPLRGTDRPGVDALDVRARVDVPNEGHRWLKIRR
jgi:hypothetical protein